MTGDSAGQRGTFERRRETYLSLPRISFNIKDMVEEKASCGLKIVSHGEGAFFMHRFAWPDPLESLRLH
ncbi:MAG: hypothetical protein RIQ68_1625 [Pseudomonadota bacterium]